MDNAGDHMLFTGRHWPCLQIDLRVSTEEEPLATQPPIVDNYHMYNLSIENAEVWPDDNLGAEVLSMANDNDFANDFYVEAGDFFSEPTDIRLDDISHMAVADVNESPLHGYDVFPDDIENDCYFNEGPITCTSPSTLTMEDIEQNGWYLDPYGEDFVNDINFMEDFWRPDRPLLRWAMADGWTQHLEDCWISSLNRRKLSRSSHMPTFKPFEEMTDEELDDHETVLLITDTIKCPGKAHKGVRMLYEFHTCKPQLNLRPFLEEFDFYLKRYVIWSLNYYYNIEQQNKNTNSLPTNKEDKQLLWSHGETEYDIKMKKLSLKMLQCSQVNELLQVYWDIILDWFTDAFDTNMKKGEEKETKKEKNVK